MCLLITLLLAAFGFFGFVGMTSEITPPLVVTVEATAEAAPVATQAIACEPAPAAQDVDQIEALMSAAFEPDIWTQTAASETYRSTAMWRSSLYGAVAYVELLHYDCGITAEQVKRFYGSGGFETIFANYTSHTMTAECVADDLRLFEFDAVSNKRDYHVLYWVKQISPTRVAGVMLTFPASRPAQQAEYAGRLFPELPTCEAAVG